MIQKTYYFYKIRLPVNTIIKNILTEQLIYGYAEGTKNRIVLS